LSTKVVRAPERYCGEGIGAQGLRRRPECDRAVASRGQPGRDQLGRGRSAGGRPDSVLGYGVVYRQGLESVRCELTLTTCDTMNGLSLIFLSFEM